MRHLLAAFALLAIGCGPDAPSALDGTCGDAPSGQQWIAAEGCRLTCSRVEGRGVPLTCHPDGGAPFCIDEGNDTAHCGACFRDCRAFCPSTTRPSCRWALCRCD
jgi:hypothetical protein